MIFEIIGAALLLLILIAVAFLSFTSEKEAEEMGVMTPRMSRDPIHLERLERETPLHIKLSREQAEELARESIESSFELGEDGVLRKKKY